MDKTSESLQQKEMDKKDLDLINVLKTLTTLPSYIGHHDPGSKIMPLPIAFELGKQETLDSIAQQLL